MAQLIYGTRQQIRFVSDAEFYESLGFLCKNDGTTSIHWERNEDQGAWGSEGRIHCYLNIGNFPNYFSNAFTAGNGRIIHRINCNEYIVCLLQIHQFALGNTQNVAMITTTIPAANIADFNRGLVL